MKGKRAEGAEKRSRSFLRSAWSKMELLRKKNRRAFTLSEVLIVVAIIAVLVAVAIPVFRGQLEKNRDSVTATNLRAAYDEATAVFLAKGKKLGDDEVKIKVDGVVFETTDKSLSGEEAGLPFTFDLDQIPPKETSTVEFVFKKNQTTVMSVGESEGGIEGFPDIPTVNDPEVFTLDSIAISGTPKTTYFVGESFSTTGMTVTATYTNGTTNDDVTGYSISPSGTLKATDTKVTVSYTEGGVTKTKDLSITVSNRTLSSISLACSDAFKRDYYVGESFSPAGMTVTATYTDGSSAAVLGYSCMPSGPYSNSDAGTVPVTVSYTEGDVTKTADVEITVIKPTLVSIAISGVETEYEEGDTFSTSGLVVTATYSDESSHGVTGYNIVTSPTNPLAAGTYEFKVEYSEGDVTVSDKVTITVIKPAPTLVSIAISGVETEYEEGDTFSTSGLVVTATYSDESSHGVTGYSIVTSPTNPLAAGTYEFKVEYSEGDITVSDKVTITVIKPAPTLESIAISGLVTEYGEGDTFSTAGLVVTATYSQGSPRELSATEYEIVSSPTSPLAVGTYEFKVEYTEGGITVSDTETITVIKLILDSIVVTTNPKKMTYYTGETFNPDGMVVTAHYQNTTITRVVNNYKCEPDKELHDKDNEIKIKYKEGKITKETKLKITIIKRTLDRIEITTPPTKTEYEEDETFDPTGMVVTAYYDVGDPDIIEDTNKFEYEPKLDRGLKVDNKFVVVSYGKGKDKRSDTQEITVNKKITSIVVTTLPTNTQYQGYEFDPTGIVVTVTYKDKSTETISDYTKLTFSPTGILSNTGRQTMTVTYKTKTTTFDITVVRSITEIKVSGIKQTYTATQAYNRVPENDLTVTAYYSEGSPRELEPNEYTIVTNPQSPGPGDDVEFTVTSKEGGKTASGTFHIDPLSGGEILQAILGNLCFASGTPITLADGSQKPVEELTFDDELLVWDFKTGMYAIQPATLLIDHGEDIYSVIDLRFSDGTMLRIVGEHGVFDYDLNRFVYISSDNAADYIGHRFVKCAPEGEYELVTLDSVENTEEQTEAWSVVSSGDFNVFASDLLTLSPPKEVFDLIPMGETLRYDMDLFCQLVAEYGTYDYEVYAQFATKEQYEALNGAYMKIPVEMGLLSFEELWALFESILSFMN